MTLPTFSAVPDEVLARVLSAHPRRCEARALARRWRSLADSRFALRCFEAPRSRRFCVDFEVDRCMSKDTYTAAFETGGPEQAHGGMEGTVAFLNWAPVYYRSAIGERRDVRHRLLQADTCALWRLIAGLLAEPRADEHAPGRPAAGPSWGAQSQVQGHLVVTEGAEGDSVRHKLGRLSAADTALVLALVDHRRNPAAAELSNGVVRNEW